MRGGTLYRALIAYYAVREPSLRPPPNSSYFSSLLSLTPARIAKRVIKQPRPPPPSESEPSRVRPKRTSGMPSTHSTALAFYLVYLWPLLPLVSTSIPGLWIERIALAGITGLGLWSRVKLGYHTVPQVFVGIATGGVSALAWKQIWKTYPAIEPWLQNLIDRAVGLVF